MTLPVTLGVCRWPGCDRALAAKAHYRDLGVYEHVGHGLCRRCAARARRGAPVAAPDLAWTERAACRGVLLPLFTSDIDGRGVPDEVEAAAWRYCHRCPVQAECAQYADDTTSRGLWAGVYRVKKSSGQREYKRYELLGGVA